MNNLKRMQHKYKVTSADFFNIKATGTNNQKEKPLLMTLVSLGLATIILTPLLSLL